MSGFKMYQSKPIEREAYEINGTEEILEHPTKPATSTIFIGGVLHEFKHYEPVQDGDFIVYLDETDIYHCSRKVFLERNEVADSV